jgi:hypothetical protein
LKQEYCDHIEGSFIGMQQNPLKGECFALYLCNNCHTTFSIPLTPEEAEMEFASLDIEEYLPKFQEAK